MGKYTYATTGVCSRAIEFEIDENGILRNVAFAGGCHGNTQGLCALAEGRDAAEVRDTLRGISCKDKATSCPDQLACAIERALASKA